MLYTYICVLAATAVSIIVLLEVAIFSVTLSPCIFSYITCTRLSPRYIVSNFKLPLIANSPIVTTSSKYSLLAALFPYIA